jgi:uncharacterized membrane protein YphA (DoxX/SURF4 family)
MTQVDTAAPPLEIKGAGDGTDTEHRPVLFRSGRVRNARRTTVFEWLRVVDHHVVVTTRKIYPWTSRIALFVVFFWFGLVKLLGLSGAMPLAEALTAKTVGVAYFHLLFTVLAVAECIIGALFLIPRAVRLVLPLLVMHLAVVCAPLVLVPELTWRSFLVPTMEGQYILKNVLVVAAACGLAAHAVPLSRHSHTDPS